MKRESVMEGSPESYLARLDDEGLNIYILKDKQMIYSSVKPGMTPLLDAVTKIDPSELRGSVVVDKIVGKAAALIISYFEAEKVYTRLLSESAIKTLEGNGISYYSEKVTGEIRDKSGSGICPFEMAIKSIEDPKEGYEELKRKFKS